MIHLLHLWRRIASCWHPIWSHGSVHDVCWKRRAHCHPLPSTVWALQQNPKLFEAARYNQINSCLAPRYDQFTSYWLVVFAYNPMNNINISWPTNHLLILRNMKNMFKATNQVMTKKIGLGNGFYHHGRHFSASWLKFLIRYACKIEMHVPDEKRSLGLKSRLNQK